MRRNWIKIEKERKEKNQPVNESPTLPLLGKTGARTTNTREEVISVVQCSAVQCSAVQCSAVQFNTVQYSAVHCIAVQ